jgi:hypothetical protein
MRKTRARAIASEIRMTYPLARFFPEAGKVTSYCEKKVAIVPVSPLAFEVSMSGVQFVPSQVTAEALPKSFSCSAPKISRMWSSWT